MFLLRPQGKTAAGPLDVCFSGLKAPSSIGKISIAEVFRLRAASAVSCDRSLSAPLRMTVFAASWRFTKSASAQTEQSQEFDLGLQELRR